MVLYLGQIVNREGIKPAEEKVKSINKAPRPTSVKELQDFLCDSERESNEDSRRKRGRLCLVC